MNGAFLKFLAPLVADLNVSNHDPILSVHGVSVLNLTSTVVLIYYCKRWLLAFPLDQLFGLASQFLRPQEVDLFSPFDLS